MQRELKSLAPPLLDSLPSEFEKTFNILERLPKYKRRRWLRAKRPEYPRFVYRYLGHEMPEAFLSDYFLESHFYLSSVAKFNDPFDMNAHVTDSNDWKKKRQRYEVAVKERYPQLNWKGRQETVNKMMCAPDQLATIRASYEKSVKDTGAICFTTDPCNLLMWSHYAAHHRGFVLQFQPANDLRKLGLLIKVDYSNDYPRVDWFDDDFYGALEKVVRTKHKGWEYEQEFRMFIVDGADTYLPFKPEALTGLIFGCRTDMELKKRVLNVLEQRTSKNLSPLKVYKAVKHREQYKVTIKRDRSLNWPS